MKKIKRILLIDDNETTNFYNEDVVRETDMFEEILVIDSGEAAIEYFEKVKSGENELPDFVLLDVKIPDYDGFEILDEIEEMDIDNIQSTVLCMLTSSRHKRDLEIFGKSPMAKEYIEKPLTEDRLKAIVEKYGR